MPALVASRTSSRRRRRPQAYTPEPEAPPGSSTQRRQQAQRRRRARARQEANQHPIVELEPATWAAREAAAQRHARGRTDVSGTQVPVPLAHLPWGTQPLLPNISHRHYLGPMDQVCPCCQALHWRTEMSTQTPPGTFSPFRTCCKFGRIDLQPLPRPPPLIDDLLSKQDSVSRHFRENIRTYNNALAFASLGVSVDPIGRTPGVPVFKIQGQLCHHIGALVPPDGSPSQFLQVYISDNTAIGQAERRHISTTHFGTRADLLATLSELMLNYNPFARLFMNAGERLRGMSVQEQRLVSVCLSTVQPWSKDPRRYNLPRSKEIGAIVMDQPRHMHSSQREIVLQARHGQRLVKINESNPHYLPLRFVLLLPLGTMGWSPEMVQGLFHGFGQNIVEPRTAAFISMRQWHAYHLFTRLHHPLSTLHRACTLLQEWVVDAWASVEQKELDWYRDNQHELRIETHAGLREALEDGVPLHRIGQRTVLPANHVGGPRYMQQTYQDCMAIVRQCGKPSLFITMTSNTNWREIREQLAPGQAVHDRPDLVARVFHGKLVALLDDLRTRAIFGKVIGYTWVVEYQKRGLPHAHILLILEPASCPRHGADVDNLVCAELPDPVSQPDLWATVTSCMLHGPCGTSHPQCPCMINNRCKSRYPRPFQETTTIDSDSYPVYRRRNNGRVFMRDGFPFTNQWVVPYSPLLCLKYDCHINVEIASAISSVKYLFKYVYKGNDRSAFVLHGPDEHVDEIRDYLDGRYISAAEACYRLLSYDISEHGPAVIRLPVHLPGEKTVLFRPTSEARATLRMIKPSKLEAFFTFCARNPARSATLLYPDCPMMLTWHDKTASWELRKRNAGRCVGRVLFVPPSSGPRFYLRLLLYHVPGPTSFQDLRTVDGAVCETYKEACSRRGLLAGDEEHHQCLDEAATFKTAHALRILFVTIILHSSPTDPLLLLEKHKSDLYDDCDHRLRQPPYSIPCPTDDQIAAHGLLELATLVQQQGRTMVELGLPEPTETARALLESTLLAEERAYDVVELEHDLLVGRQTANSDQLDALTAVSRAVARKGGGLFFLDGPGGTGKTFVEKLCLATVRVRKGIALAVASSGVASLLLPGGRTAHSRFKIPVHASPDSMCAVSSQSPLAQLFREAELIVWDEAVMQHVDCFAAVDRMLRDVRGNVQPFGGIVMLFAGDLRQCLPVIPKATPTAIILATLTNAAFWADVQVLRLQHNMRLVSSADPRASRAFASWLLTVGNGTSISPNGTVTLPHNTLLPAGSSRQDLINHVYPNIASHTPGDLSALANFFDQRVILAPHNKSVDQVNSLVLHTIQGPVHPMWSADTAVNDNGQPSNVPVELLNTLDPAGFPLHHLELKVGCPVVLLRNLAPGAGLCNGTRLLVVHIGQRVLRCLVLSGPGKGTSVLLPRIRLTANPSTELPFTLHRTQFPIRLAFAMTINKAQGQSLSHAGLDLTLPCFAHGQLYVGLSRATSPDAVKVLLPPDGYPACQTPNVVYGEVLGAAGLGYNAVDTFPVAA